MIELDIRQEEEKYYNEVKDLIYKAFKNEQHTDNDEHNLVGRLRKSDKFIKELSLVAKKDGKIVGHIMTTKLDIIDGDKKYTSLALAPLSVDPDCQRMGVGAQLINRSFEIAKDLGYESIFVLGSELYYPKFGFSESLEFNLKAPFDVPSINFMAKELVSDALKNVNGNIVFAKEFFEK